MGKLVWESQDPEVRFEDVMYHNEYARDMERHQRSRSEAREAANNMQMSLRQRPKDLSRPSETLTKARQSRVESKEVGTGLGTGAGPQSRTKRSENVVSSRSVKLIKDLQDDLKSSNWIDRQRKEQEAAKKAQDENQAFAFAMGLGLRKASIAGI